MKISKMKWLEWVVGFIFLFIGFIFISTSLIATIHSANFKKHAIAHTALIKDIESYQDKDGETNHRVFVEYIVNNEIYNRPLGFYNSNMHIGQEVEIYYAPDSPNTIMYGSNTILFTIFSVIGLALFTTGFILTFFQIKKKKTRKFLLENGRKVYAEITEVTLNDSYSVNERDSYTILCKYEDPLTGISHVFKSDHMYINPKPILCERQITALAVYIDRENPKKYYVALEEI